MVEVPPGGVREDRLGGMIDIDEALREGLRAFEPGRLAKANHRLLDVDGGTGSTTTWWTCCWIRRRGGLEDGEAGGGGRSNDQGSPGQPVTRSIWTRCCKGWRGPELTKWRLFRGSLTQAVPIAREDSHTVVGNFDVQPMKLSGDFLILDLK
jgi:hypothetical protein